MQGKYKIEVKFDTKTDALGLKYILKKNKTNKKSILKSLICLF